jgi:hypothetical protein
MVKECEAMAHYATASGLPLTNTLVKQLEAITAEGGGASPATATQVARAHATLSKLVAPATPHTLLLLEIERERAPRLRFLGPVPFMRHMMLTAIVCLLAFIGLAMSPNINTDSIADDIFTSHGTTLLLNLVFLLLAAGIGGSFSALFTANKYIADCNFDPKFVSSYWNRFALGLIAGLILAEMVPFDPSSLEGVTKPTLAMLGGFSASVVYLVLQRLVDSVKTLVIGNATDRVEAKVAVTRAKEQVEAVKTRTSMTAHLESLREQLAGGADAASLTGRVTAILDELDPGREEPAPS